MSPVLITIIVVLVLSIAGLAWVWLLGRPKSAKYRSYAGASADAAAESSHRNRAWDAAVARARNRHF